MANLREQVDMAEPTQTAGTTTTPPAYAYCAWHQGVTRDVRLIQIDETGSGPGTGRQKFACHPCQITHGLVPLADR
ncbi:hypothetical protein ACFWBS_51000 [Streptomyces mirabilis]|uniref:hypothetical protein n=1 Tax=Streptomyces TaxID=1883 RepID=UPI00211BBBDB|nr:hypothetical protein [Streptomyces sp. OK228]